MNDKVSELRKILNQKKAQEAKKNMQQAASQSFDPETTLVENVPENGFDSDAQAIEQAQESAVNQQTESNTDDSAPSDPAPANQSTTPNGDGMGDVDDQMAELQNRCAHLEKAAAIQKDMYLAKAAEFENYKKRLQKEHDEFARYANEKLISELLPILDSLEMTLSHGTGNEDDAILSGVKLTHRQFVQILAKFGVEEVRGEGLAFNPNLQEAISLEENSELGPDKVTKVHRTGFTLNGRVVRAAMVTVSK